MNMRIASAAMAGQASSFSPLYGGGRRHLSHQRSKSLRDIMDQQGMNSDTFSPIQCIFEHDTQASSITTQKFRGAIMRLRAAQKIGSITNQHHQAGALVSPKQIKNLVSRPELRKDILAAPSMTPKDDKVNLLQIGKTGKVAPIAALRTNSPGMIAWNLVQVVLLVYIIIYIPYRVSFSNINETGCRRDSELQHGMDLFLDTFYLADLAVSAATQSVNDEGLPLLYLKDSVPHYLGSWVFFRDLVPSIPMSWIEFLQKVENDEDCSTSSSGATKLLRILRTFRVFRVFKLFNIKFIHDFLRHTDPNFKTLAALFLSLLILVHLLASMWFFVKKDSDSIDAWYTQQGLESGSSRPLQVYLSCVYFIIATLATVGFGDISANHDDERILAIGIMLIGTIVFALIISTASMIVQSSNSEDSAHGTKIALVHDFCNSWKISETIKYNILDFFLSSKEIFHENNNTKSVMGLLPPEYKNIVAPHVAAECIGRTVLFKGSSPQFMSFLLEQLHLVSYGACDILFQFGDVSDSIFIIKSGTCLMVNQNNVVTSELSDGDVIGEVSCFSSSPREYTCVCSKFCEFYVIHAPSLVQIFKLFPDFMKSFSEYCRRKLLVDMSTKRQFYELIHDKSYHDLAVPNQTSVQSPTFATSIESMSSFHQLKPLPKGKYKTPIVPHLAAVMNTRASQTTHAQRIRLFAEIQMALSNFDFAHLATRYDRIINASRDRTLQTKSKQAETFASIVESIGQILSSYQHRLRFDPSLSVGNGKSVSPSVNSGSSHFMPGEFPWHARHDAQIEVDGSHNSLFLSFFSNISNTHFVSTVLDNRSQFDSASVSLGIWR